MPSYGIHLAVAKKYLDVHPEENENDFIQGTLDVDLAEDRIASHYTVNTDHSDLVKFLNGKVDPYSYTSEHTINSSYDRGYFQHLMTDYYFYTEFFDKECLCGIDYDEFKKVMYHDYKSVNRHLVQKYNIEYPEVVKKYNIVSEEDSIAIHNDALDNFIDRVSSIDLDNLYSNFRNQKVK